MSLPRLPVVEHPSILSHQLRIIRSQSGRHGLADTIPWIQVADPEMLRLDVFHSAEKLSHTWNIWGHRALDET
jgi:hypothetical protein